MKIKPNLEAIGSNAIFCEFFFVPDATASTVIGAGEFSLMKVQKNAKLSSILGGDFVGGEVTRYRRER